MIWLERPPWAKWVAVAAFAMFALWMEIKPEPVTDHPFATTDIGPGEEVGAHNTELRRVPDGLFEPAETGAHALASIPTGAPVLASQVGTKSQVVPSGWWIVAMEVPQGALVGDRVKIVVLDEGQLVDGVISATGVTDGLGVALGGVAIAPEQASRVAAAASSGRVSVLLSTR